jgi:nucleoside-diphosphate-sugar epimerase
VNVFEAARRVGIPHVVYTSSIAVFDWGQHIVSRSWAGDRSAIMAPTSWPTKALPAPTGRISVCRASVSDQ